MPIVCAFHVGTQFIQFVIGLIEACESKFRICFILYSYIIYMVKYSHLNFVCVCNSCY